MLFFTFSGNILYTYVLPGLPAFSIMVTELLSHRFDIQPMMRSKWLYASAIIPVMGILFMSILWTAPEKLSFEKNQQYLVEVYQHSRRSEESRLAYVGERLFSIDFYTQGQSEHLDLHSESYKHLIQNTTEDYLITPKNLIPHLPKEMLKHFEVFSEYRKYALLKEHQIK